MMRGVTVAVVVVLVEIAAAAGFIYSGLYNIAASDPHNPVVRWAFDTMMERSVRVRADEISVPTLAQQPLDAGVRHYQKSCVQCHGAPGVEPEEFAQAMRPEPPDLAQSVGHLKPAELFWIAKHGIKMSAMPAFGSVHEDNELWAIVALLERLPEMSADDYKSIMEIAVSRRSSALGRSSGLHGKTNGADNLIPGAFN